MAPDPASTLWEVGETVSEAGPGTPESGPLPALPGPPGPGELPHAWRATVSTATAGKTRTEGSFRGGGRCLTGRGRPRHIVAGVPRGGLLICTARARGRLDCPESPDVPAPAGRADLRG